VVQSRPGLPVAGDGRDDLIPGGRRCLRFCRGVSRGWTARPSSPRRANYCDGFVPALVPGGFSTATLSPRFSFNDRFLRVSENKAVIEYGETGDAVRILQQSLIELGYWMDKSLQKFNTPGGIFGSETRDRVKAFQAGHGLYPDGRVGFRTLNKLSELLPGMGPILPPLPKKASFTHRVKLHFRSLTLTNVPLSSQEANARMVYAKYGIYLDILSGMTMILSEDELKVFDEVDVGECVDNKLSTELADLHKIGLQGVAANEVVVYFAPKLKNAKHKPLNGCAAINSDRPALVVSATSTPWTLAHELGHVLLEKYSPVHSTDTANVMFKTTAGITSFPPDLDTEQLKAIKASKYITVY
jgi:hypothetical protein